ncbi:long-chain-fatty-acid--CoA ligase 4-like [Watersipora subatra]|uniref:long-chain-fatty-acid--CoA ligase 4-like n=1 Tax=Watersipora subatra TaxID=2589382 RepID=UPI00355C5AD1
MPLLESALLTALKTISFFYDVVTFIPYYFYQQQGQVLRESNACKATLRGGPEGYWGCIGEPVLTTTPDADCQTLAELFEKSVLKYGEQPCLGTRQFFREEDELQPNGKVFKKSILGEYDWTSYNEVMQDVKNFGRGLALSGLSPTMYVLIFAETRADWIIAAQACFRQNFPVITLYATLGDEAIIYGINQTEVTHIVTSADLVHKFKKVLSKTPKVKHITYMKGRTSVNPAAIVDGRDVTIVSSEELIARGAAQGNTYVDTMPAPNDLAVIMYTSGSTGLPKGVLLSHSNVMAACSGLLARVKARSDDVYVGYLPLAHILELSAEIACIYAGCRIGYSSPNTLADTSTAIKKGQKGDVSLLRPTVMACVPTVMDRIYKSVWEKVESGSLIKRLLFKFAVYYKGRWLPRGGETPVFNKIVMSSITSLLGGRVRGMLSGGAPLNPKTQEFLRLTLCAPIVQGYGLTETCAAGTVGDLNDLKDGHVGSPLSCTRIKLVSWEEGNYRVTDSEPSGEVWIGGPCVALGYFKEAEKTAEEFVEEQGIRWFKTGDIGRIAKDGTLTIVDRKKDLVKLQAGEYVSLGKVEACLKLCPLVDNICVFANSMHMYTVAIVVPNPKALQQLADSMEISSGWAALCSNPAITEQVLKQMKAQAQGSLQKFEVPQKIMLTEEVWTPDTGLVTDSLKLKRKPLSDHYSTAVQNLYGAS